MEETDMDRLAESGRSALLAIRRGLRMYRKTLRIALPLAVMGLSSLALASPALANDGAKPSLLPTCGATLPLTTPCTPAVTAGGGGSYSVMLPGIGTLNFTIDPATNLVTAASVSGLSANFTASTPKVDADGDSIKVTFTSTTDPSQVYRVKVGVKPPTTPGGSPTVTAKVKGAHHSEKGEVEHENEHHGGAGPGSGDHD
jgi:hypothetical protein